MPYATGAIQKTSVIISVFSTSPGIGKTVVAINLAAGLANEGYKVCLADLDLQFGDVLNYLKLTSSHTIAGAQTATLLSRFCPRRSTFTTPTKPMFKFSPKLFAA